jgi:hypothetical protein
MSKFYIETDSRQFIIQADDVGQAIAMLWCRELRGLRDFTDAQLEFVHWSQLAIEPEHYVHFGQRENGAYVHSRCAVNWLTGWQVTLAVDCIFENYGIEVLQDFFPQEHRS